MENGPKGPWRWATEAAVPDTPLDPSIEVAAVAHPSDEKEGVVRPEDVVHPP